MSGFTTHTRNNEYAIAPDQIATRDFYWGDRISYDVPRSLSTGSSAWLKSHLVLIMTETGAALAGDQMGEIQGHSH